MGLMKTEQDVLAMLNIPDFRHITKENVLMMASSLDKMSPEVAMKVLEQIPDFSKNVRIMLDEFRSTLDKGLEANNSSVRSYYDTCTSIINSLNEYISDKQISFEERKYIIDKMLEINEMISKKDSENKGFIIKMGTLGVASVVGVVGVLATLLGGNTKFHR